MFVAQHAIELRNQTGGSVESLDVFIVAAVRGKSESFPAAESFAAQNEQRSARSELDCLLQKSVENVDLRFALLDRLHGGLDARCVRAAGTFFRLEAFFKLGDRLLDVRQEGNGVDVCLGALQGGFELLIDDFPNVFDRGADFSHHFLDRLANVRLDRGRDVVAPHRH